MKEIEQLNVSLTNKIPDFGTTRNMILISLYNFLTIGVQAGVGGGTSGFLIYLGKYNMAYVWLQVAGIISSIFAIFIGIFAGYYGDKIQSKYGRRKPLIFIGNVLNIIANFFLANLELFIEKTQVSVVVWYIVCLVIGTIGVTLSTTAFNSWLLESTSDENDYRNIQSKAVSVCVYSGVIVGGLSIAFLPSYSTVVNVASPLSTIAFLLLLWLLPNPICRKVEKQPELIPSVRTCMRTKEFIAGIYLYNYLFFIRILI